MTGLLTLSTPAASFPVTLEELKSQLRIAHNDDDALLNTYISGACQYVEEASGCAVLTQTWKYSVDCAPASRLVLPKYPVTAIAAIDYFDADNAAQSATIGDFALYDSGVEAWLQPNDGVTWPTVYNRPDALSVTFTVGGALDKYRALRQAVLMIAADWFEQPTATAEQEKREVPFGVTQLINLHRREWIAA